MASFSSINSFKLVLFSVFATCAQAVSTHHQVYEQSFDPCEMLRNCQKKNTGWIIAMWCAIAAVLVCCAVAITVLVIRKRKSSETGDVVAPADETQNAPAAQEVTPPKERKFLRRRSTSALSSSSLSLPM